ncbi:protein kinase domain-containing protein [Nocardioides sp. AE5]|uniref:serine/threonine-protein kinase n=1 Tax=Nocardioides sp. AE5 TaxID=2962573 RepID=UPI00288217E8|nr:protein kinase [Nocardioides sp. AE5]MDT0200974.1 protein kinase [Nocardioides sp. AE5]
MAGLPQEGQSFGRYDISRRIGRGGMGVVYAAVQRGLGREVALKVLSSDLSDSEEYRHRFLREAEVLARLDSPHIIQVHDAGEEDGWLYIATQYVPDGDLQQLLADSGPLDPALALDLTGQVADGIEAAHRAGIIHRDIKPSNVLLRRRGDDEIQAYVCDLGISRVMDSQHTKTQGVIGTFAYMAPERHEGLDATEASDVYALGCLLWATLSGQAPYRGTDGQVLMGHLQGAIPQLPATDARSRAINDILLRSMAKAPGERYPSAEEFRAACAAAARLDVSGPAVPPAPLNWPAPQQPFPSGTQHQSGPQASQHQSGPQQPPSGQQFQSGPQQHAGPHYQSGPQTFAAQHLAPQPAQQWSAPARQGNDNKWTWIIGGLTAIVLVIGVVVVVALNVGGDDPSSPGGGGGTGSVADAPKDASVDDFCAHFPDTQGTDFDAIRAAYADLVEVGTPDDMTAAQRKGFEHSAESALNSSDLNDFQVTMGDLAPSERTDAYSFDLYGLGACN